MTHLSTLKARVRPHFQKHMQALGLKRTTFRIVPSTGMPWGSWSAIACYYGNAVYFNRKPLEAHADNPEWIDDVCAHELMHAVHPPREDGGRHHGPKYRRAMVDYGYHPMALAWRKK